MPLKTHHFKVKTNSLKKKKKGYFSITLHYQLYYINKTLFMSHPKSSLFILTSSVVSDNSSSAFKISRGGSAQMRKWSKFNHFWKMSSLNALTCLRSAQFVSQLTTIVFTCHHVFIHSVVLVLLLGLKYHFHALFVKQYQTNYIGALTQTLVLSTLYLYQMNQDVKGITTGEIP